MRLAVSGINPGDMKKRSGWQGAPMRYARVIPHSDGAGVIDAVGAGVSPDRIGQHVCCYGAQSYRPFGTAAGFCCGACAVRSAPAKLGARCVLRPHRRVARGFRSRYPTTAPDRHSRSDNRATDQARIQQRTPSFGWQASPANGGSRGLSAAPLKYPRGR
ncbi:hypothetical protein [Mesorhizobium sp. M0460]|uniref:alcohol dehydrogenase catalytic domain-containing protein n=1 Tax=unclassified Mesorhizobium TaxID=325217 RepID=UPI0033374239